MTDTATAPATIRVCPYCRREHETTKKRPDCKACESAYNAGLLVTYNGTKLGSGYLSPTKWLTAQYPNGTGDLTPIPGTAIAAQPTTDTGEATMVDTATKSRKSRKSAPAAPAAPATDTATESAPDETDADSQALPVAGSAMHAPATAPAATKSRKSRKSAPATESAPVAPATDTAPVADPVAVAESAVAAAQLTLSRAKSDAGKARAQLALDTAIKARTRAKASATRARKAQGSAPATDTDTAPVADAIESAPAAPAGKASGKRVYTQDDVTASESVVAESESAVAAAQLALQRARSDTGKARAVLALDQATKSLKASKSALARTVKALQAAPVTVHAPARSPRAPLTFADGGTSRDVSIESAPAGAAKRSRRTYRGPYDVDAVLSAIAAMERDLARLRAMVSIESIEPDADYAAIIDAATGSAPVAGATGSPKSPKSAPAAPKSPKSAPAASRNGHAPQRDNAAILSAIKAYTGVTFPTGQSPRYWYNRYKDLSRQVREHGGILPDQDSRMPQLLVSTKAQGGKTLAQLAKALGYASGSALAQDIVQAFTLTQAARKYWDRPQ